MYGIGVWQAIKEKGYIYSLNPVVWTATDLVMQGIHAPCTGCRWLTARLMLDEYGFEKGRASLQQ